MKIRCVQTSEIPKFMKLLKHLDEETTFMLHEPGERNPESEKDRLQQILSSKVNCVLVAEDDDHDGFIGFCMVFGNGLRRIQHRGSLVIGVREAWYGKGAAPELMDKAESWAIEKGIERLELTVMAHNRRAMGLYDKQGFRVEGTRKHAIKQKDKFVDEFYMGKVLG